MAKEHNSGYSNAAYGIMNYRESLCQPLSQKNDRKFTAHIDRISSWFRAALLKVITIIKDIS